MTAQEVETQHPEAVRIARMYREVFGDGVRLVYALNKDTGNELKTKNTLDHTS